MLSMNSEKYLVGWREISTHLGVHERTARRWVLSRGLPVEKFEDDRRVYALASVLQIRLESLRISRLSALAQEAES